MDIKKKKSIEYHLARSTLGQRYEDLRSEVIGSSSAVPIGRQGFALFVHQGMIGWIEAWSKCEIQPLHDIKNKESSIRSNLPMDLRGQMTMLLTNMVVSIVQGD